MRLIPSARPNTCLYLTLASSPLMPPIDLRKGHPHPSLLPTAPLATALADILRNPDAGEGDTHPNQYGPDPGNLTTRKQLARFLKDAYGSECSHAQPVREEDGAHEERICLTGGASGALGYILQLFADRAKTRVIMVTPTYFFAGRVFVDAGYEGRIHSVDWEVETSGAGLADRLEALLVELSRKDSAEKKVEVPERSIPTHIYSYIVYLPCITHNNPTGQTLSIEERTRLVRLARQTNALLLSDDVYDFLTYHSSGQTLPPRIVDIDYTLPGRLPWGNTLSNGSWSKIFGGGVRSGWLESADRRLATTYSQGGANKSGGDMGHFMSCAIGRMLVPDNGGKRIADGVITMLREAYSARAKSMVRSILDEFPEGSAVYGGHGGYFLWVAVGREEDGIDSREFVKAASDVGVRLLGCEECFAPGQEGSGRFIRLSVCWESEDRIAEGIKRLGMVARDLVEKKRSGMA